MSAVVNIFGPSANMGNYCNGTYNPVLLSILLVTANMDNMLFKFYPHKKTVWVDYFVENDFSVVY